MQIFLTKPETFKANEAVKLVFDGNELRTYLNDYLTDVKKAKVGDSFYIQPKGLTKLPVIVKAELPSLRGERIAWCLSFCDKKKYANSYQEFIKVSDELIENGSFEQIFCKTKTSFAFLIVCDNSKCKNGIPKKQPKLAWISDEITDTELDDLLKSFSEYRKIYTPIEFIKLM